MCWHQVLRQQLPLPGPFLQLVGTEVARKAAQPAESRCDHQKPGHHGALLLLRFSVSGGARLPWNAGAWNRSAVKRIPAGEDRYLKLPADEGTATSFQPVRRPARPMPCSSGSKQIPPDRFFQVFRKSQRAVRQSASRGIHRRVQDPCLSSAGGNGDQAKRDLPEKRWDKYPIGGEAH